MVKQATAQLFRLTPIWVPEEPPAKRAKKTPESAASTQDASMASGEAKGGKESSDESDSDSSGSNSDFSSEDGSSDASDLPAFRNDVLWGKQVLIGCGGGFHQECSQPYSPVAKWMEDADVALNDEGQQYGNLDEASAVARTPRKCLVIWCGDHKQTPGGLRKTDEAKAFRRKLLRRPTALRGNTEYLQPNMLGKVVLRYLEDVDDPIVNELREMVRETIGGTQPLSEKGVATLRTVCQEVGCAFHARLCIQVCCTALSVLWLALHKEKFPLLADTLMAAAGVAGKQKWALILPSSARVSMVTYTTVIAVRYPELDNVQNDLTCFGNYLLGPRCTEYPWRFPPGVLGCRLCLHARSY